MLGDTYAGVVCFQEVAVKIIAMFGYACTMYDRSAYWLKDELGRNRQFSPDCISLHPRFSISLPRCWSMMRMLCHETLVRKTFCSADSYTLLLPARCPLATDQLEHYYHGR